MGVHAARQFRDLVRLARDVLATEALAAAQGVDFVGLEPAPPVRAALQAVREASPRLEDDRPLAPDIARVGELIGSGVVLAAVHQIAREIA